MEESYIQFFSVHGITLTYCAGFASQESEIIPIKSSEANEHDILPTELFSESSVVFKNLLPIFFHAIHPQISGKLKTFPST